MKKYIVINGGKQIAGPIPDSYFLFSPIPDSHIKKLPTIDLIDGNYQTGEILEEHINIIISESWLQGRSITEAYPINNIT